jgi:hypothetical protein
MRMTRQKLKFFSWIPTSNFLAPLFRSNWQDLIVRDKILESKR